jgi:putative heme-binding domain-containing protein
MKPSRLAIALIVTALATVAPVRAQTATNPFAGNETAIKAGMGLFRIRCADCHGIDAKGVRGPDLTQIWSSGRTDDGLFRTLRTGVPGTEMPAIDVRTPDDEVWKLLAYLRTIAAPAATDQVAGNAQNGEKIFRASCAGCHRVNGKGGRLGPDLSRAGIGRARAVLVRRIRGAFEDSLSGYEPVSITTKNGQTIQGVKKNEDLNSVQIMDTRERIQGYLRSDVREVADGKRSAMPVFGPERLPESDLNDLLAYMATRRGFDPSVK